ncbi:ABC transporter permease [Pseudonocardia kujensis]|uniref:ABC transporter permease n=1 Tax=Pseudonocardia kujensis TaxID=1128675 RepID=UPI001E4A286F|nr:ABC transporter permease [Pseudonocardia kujensis]MCE0761614.1 ABC transporter permease [Pseudonocardia kujensis]
MTTLPAPSSWTRRVQAVLHRHPRLRLSGLLAPALLWLVLLYLVPLVLLLLTAFAETDSFTGQITWTLSADTVLDVLTTPAYLFTALRTVLVAVGVTVLCAVLALPLATYMALVAAPRRRPLLVALVVTPLWASYLVKVYAWRILLAPEGVLGGASPGYGWTAVVVTLTYLWLPYMVMPVYTGISALRGSYLEAAADLGARPWTTFRTVVLPVLKPAIAAGSVFTFSLSLGDYITVQLVGGTNQMLGNLVYANFSTDLPLAAALAVLPLIVMAAYLLTIRRTGALDRL